MPFSARKIRTRRGLGANFACSIFIATCSAWRSLASGNGGTLVVQAGHGQRMSLGHAPMLRETLTKSRKLLQ